MTVVYLIYVAGHGRGGHFYSLLETAEKVGKQIDVTIVSIGVRKSPVLDKFDGNYLHFEDRGLFKTLCALSILAREKGFTTIHAFDTRAFLFARLMSIKENLPLVLTKCGGPNPDRYFPYHSKIVLFSQENKEYFEEKYKFQNADFSVIANRVEISRRGQDQSRIDELKSILKPGVPVILRINRIGSTYEKSIKQGINLVKNLAENGVETQLLVIGVVEDQDAFERLVESVEENVTFVTDERYTVRASELIDIADIVIGTGRGFMEAALLGKTMLSPTENLSLPMLVTKDRIAKVFAKNFSQRYETDLSSEQVLSEIRSLLTGTLDQSELVDVTDFAEENFSSAKIFEKYIPVYQNAEPAKLNIFDLLKHVFTLSRARTTARNLIKRVSYEVFDRR